jgi:hypothetical protein
MSVQDQTVHVGTMSLPLSAVGNVDRPSLPSHFHGFMRKLGKQLHDALENQRDGKAPKPDERSKAASVVLHRSTPPTALSPPPPRKSVVYRQAKLS